MRRDFVPVHRDPRCPHQCRHRPGPAAAIGGRDAARAGGHSRAFAGNRRVRSQAHGIGGHERGSRRRQRNRIRGTHPGCHRIELRILSGEDEANLIGRGLTADPQLAGWQDFYVFDLGGGSLECLVFRGRRVEQAFSLPLGCVRLAERHVGDLEVPFGESQRSAVTAVCRETFARSGFRFSLPAEGGVVFAGGTVTTVRAILGEKSGVPFSETSPVISVGAVRAMLDEVGARALASRQQIPGLPAARADVFPTALTTVLAVAEIGGFSSFLHSS